MITAAFTNNGRELALKLSAVIGTTNEITSICSLVCRHATTLHRLNEDECNGHPAMGNPNIDIKRANRLQERWEHRVARGQFQACARLQWLVDQLPDKWRLEAESDPRGCTVLVYEGDDEFRGDSWGDSRGVCVPDGRKG